MAVYLLLLISVALNVAFSVQLRDARAALRPTPFLSGNVAPSIELRSAGGATDVVRYGRGELPVLFYWISPSCTWCELNLPNLRALIEQADGKYRLLLVSGAEVSELKAYSLAKNLDAPIHNISAGTARQYRFAGTPDTLLVSGDGSFLGRWTGAYSPSNIDSIERILGVKLPGVWSSRAPSGATR